MLYLVELERELELQPRFFGPRLREVLEQKLISEVCIFATFQVIAVVSHLVLPNM